MGLHRAAPHPVFKNDFKGKSLPGRNQQRSGILKKNQ